MAANSGQSQIALVSYIPYPLASLLYDLRQILPGHYHPEPHITLLPPRPLQIDLESACDAMDSVLESHPPFEIQLSEVCHFPATNTFYLAVKNGADELCRLHGRLNRGDLQHSESFAFRPHLTIGGPVDPKDVENLLDLLAAAWGANACEPRFLLREAICLHLEDSKGWQRVRSKQLGVR